MAVDYSGGLLGQVGGAIGLTDPYKAQRSLNEMKSGQANASAQLDADTAGAMGLLRDASQGRSLTENLNAYDQNMGQARSQLSNANDLTLAQQNAGSSENVQGYLNPQMDMMLSNTMQRMQGSAGAGLQSSAANKNTANAVAQQAGNLWQQAYQNAMGDAQNNLNVANASGQNALQGANLAQAQLDNSNQPITDYLSLANDKAMQRYAGNIGITQAAGTAAGGDQSLIGGILGG